MAIDKNKIVKSKKKFSINKIKKMFKNLGLCIKKGAINLGSYISKLPSYVKVIAIVWIVLLLLLVSLIVFCNINNKSLKEYDLVVTEMNRASLEYVINEELYAGSDKPIKVTLDELVSNAYYNTESAPVPKTCTGYSVIFYNSNKVVENENDKYSIESYINCKEFTSKDYNDYLNG